jgi:hypothetical protein
LFQPVHTPETCDNTIQYQQEYECQQKEKIEYKTSNHTVIKQYASPVGVNCVLYAKSKAHVPIGVGTLKQKLSKITSYTPAVGKVGVTKEGSIGHLVVVEEVKDSTLIISEGNYRHGYITWREVNKNLIEGYL